MHFLEKIQNKYFITLLLVTNGIAAGYLSIQLNYDISSDHTPLIATRATSILQEEQPLRLHNKHTNWKSFRRSVESKINVQIPLKTKLDVEKTVNSITCIIQKAAWTATSQINAKTQIYNCPKKIKDKVREKRRLKKMWQQSGYPTDKEQYERVNN